MWMMETALASHSTRNLTVFGRLSVSACESIRFPFSFDIPLCFFRNMPCNPLDLLMKISMPLSANSTKSQTGDPQHSSDKVKAGSAAGGKGSGSAILPRKSSLNFFERFRTSKQDKIAADVQAKIRAVRAAEDLDRRVNAKKSK